MTSLAIRVDGLSKEYVIGGGAERRTFREAISAAATAPIRALRGRGRSSEPQRFRALDDVSFEINAGEVVGIIGRNGAGKSTLLKILSRITAPTRGRVEIEGRIASLLEVGTGFHPELTGRENVRLNGAILGMTGREISRKFDEIVAFSGVEKFIDTPVKRYSSGMQVRLAFAVAAHLDPEILLVDEVLAVGDAEFQKKCLGKMGEIAGQGGRTVLFVSHQLGMVARLCTRAILLAGGRVAFSGGSDETIERYVASGANRVRLDVAADPRLKDLGAIVRGIETIGADGAQTEQFALHTPIRLRVHLLVRQALGGMMLGVGIDNRHSARVSTWVARVADLVGDNKAGVDENGNLALDLEVAPRIIAPGGYHITAALFEPGGTVYHRLDDEAPFMIIDSGSELSAFNFDYGVALVPAVWSVGHIAMGSLK